MSTKTRFEEEAKGNSEMAYYLSSQYLSPNHLYIGLLTSTFVLDKLSPNLKNMWFYHMIRIATGII